MIESLPFGQHNAVTKKALAQKLGVSSREVEAEIERLRKSSEAGICSGTEGYWRPLSSEEYQENIERRKRRAIHQLLTVRGEKRLLRRWREQALEQGRLWAA